MKFLQISFLTLAAALLSWGAVAKEPSGSTREWIAGYDSKEEHNLRPIAEFALERTERGFAISNSYIQVVLKKQPMYCVPKNLTFTGPQLAMMLRDELKRNPKIGDENWELGFFDMMRDVFPC